MKRIICSAAAAALMAVCIVPADAQIRSIPYGDMEKWLANTLSEGAKFFDASCEGWCKDPEANLNLLKMKQAVANNMLKDQGYLYLNDVYDLLDIPRTKFGHMAGWIYNEKNPVGDNFVDFGIFNKDNEATRRFVNGLEPTILLDFNIDGNIYDLM